MSNHFSSITTLSSEEDICVHVQELSGHFGLTMIFFDIAHACMHIFFCLSKS